MYYLFISILLDLAINISYSFNTGSDLIKFTSSIYTFNKITRDKHFLYILTQQKYPLVPQISGMPEYIEHINISYVVLRVKTNILFFLNHSPVLILSYNKKNVHCPQSKTLPSISACNDLKK